MAKYLSPLLWASGVPSVEAVDFRLVLEDDCLGGKGELAVGLPPDLAHEENVRELFDDWFAAKPTHIKGGFNEDSFNEKTKTQCENKVRSQVLDMLEGNETAFAEVPSNDRHLFQNGKALGEGSFEKVVQENGFLSSPRYWFRIEGAKQGFEEGKSYKVKVGVKKSDLAPAYDADKWTGALLGQINDKHTNPTEIFNLVVPFMQSFELHPLKIYKDPTKTEQTIRVPPLELLAAKYMEKKCPSGDDSKEGSFALQLLGMDYSSGHWREKLQEKRKNPEKDEAWSVEEFFTRDAFTARYSTKCDEFVGAMAAEIHKRYPSALTDVIAKLLEEDEDGDLKFGNRKTLALAAAIAVAGKPDQVNSKVSERLDEIGNKLDRGGKKSAEVDASFNILRSQFPSRPLFRKLTRSVSDGTPSVSGSVLFAGTLIGVAVGAFAVILLLKYLSR